MYLFLKFNYLIFNCEILLMHQPYFLWSLSFALFLYFEACIFHNYINSHFTESESLVNKWYTLVFANSFEKQFLIHNSGKSWKDWSCQASLKADNFRNRTSTISKANKHHVSWTVNGHLFCPILSVQCINSAMCIKLHEQK